MSLFDDLLTQTKSPKNPQEQSSLIQADPLAPASPIIISALTPLISLAGNIIEPPSTPLEAPAGPMITLGSDNNSIIFSTEGVSTTPIIDETTPAVEVANTSSATDSLIADFMPEDPLVNSPLFGMTTPVVTPVVAIPVESIETRVVAHDLPFHDTKGYVDHAIDEVSDLIEGIDAEDAKTLAAENEHRRQKEYFAGLEIADEISHQKHLEERSHAEKMKKYFEKEQGAVAKKNEEKEVVTA